MKNWIIKRKGKAWWGNVNFDYCISIKENKFWAGLFFLRRKDAIIYLKTQYKENLKYYEVIGCNLPISKQDNRH